MRINDDSYKYNYLIPNENIRFPVKINIHIPIRGNLYFECVGLNKKIIEVTKSEVSFSPSSFHIPHMTLYMGFAINLSNLELTLKKTEEFANSITRFEMQISKPYIKKPQYNWIFFDASPADYIINIKHQLKEKVGICLEPLSWDVVQEKPHITIAYIKQNFTEIEKLLQDWNTNITSYAEAMEVSFSGARGSCIGSIRTYELTG